MSRGGEGGGRIRCLRVLRWEGLDGLDGIEMAQKGIAAFRAQFSPFQESDYAPAANSSSCCWAGLAGAIGRGRSGRPTPFGANRSGLSPRRNDLHGSVMDGQRSAEELVLDDLFWMD